MIKFKKVKIQNFLSFKDAEFELDNKGMSLILGQNDDFVNLGSNGSGKSALFESIYYALFGKTLRDVGIFDVVHENEKKSEVELEFSNNGDLYKIVRTRTKSSGNLSVFVNDKDVSLKDMTETQKQVINSLIDPDIVKNAIFFAGSVFQSFVTLSDIDKKNVITKILGFDKFEKVREQVKVQLNSYKDLYQKVHQKEELIDQALERLKQEKSELDKFNIGETNKQLQECDSKMTSMIEEVKNFDKGRDEEKDAVDNLHDKLDYLIADIMKFKDEYARQETRKSEWNNQLKKMEDLISKGRCPTCTQEIGKDVFSEQCEDSRNSISGAEKNLKNLSITIEDLEEKQCELNEEYGKHNTGFKQYQYMAKQKNDEIEELRKIQKELSLKVKEYDVKLERIGKSGIQYEDEKAKLFSEKVKLEHKINIYTFWVEGFGPQGIVSYILDFYFPKFNTLLNEYLQILFGSGVIAKFVPYTKLKSSDEIREKWDFDIIGLKNYKAASSGERRRIDVAVLFALNSLVREMMGGSNILVVDEVFDPLDDIGSEKVVELLKIMNISSVFVITHNEQLQEKFDKVYVVKKKDKQSTILEL